MSSNSNIEWTDATWNITSGCTKVSPGCANCYIERTPPFRMAGRKFVKGKIPLVFHEDRIDMPRHWKKPRRVFVNSLSDLFHKDVPEALIDQVFRVMVECKQHTFQVLTKRPERMLDYTVKRWGTFDNKEYPLAKNIWLGVSVEDQKRADERIQFLERTPAAVKFLSCEPLLGPIVLINPDRCMGGIDWVIVGGESGPGSRQCDLAWIRSIVEQCRTAGVACFVKQLGADPTVFHNGIPNHDVDFVQHLRADGLLKDKKGGDMAEWPEDLRVREFPC